MNVETQKDMGIPHKLVRVSNQHTCCCLAAGPSGASHDSTESNIAMELIERKRVDEINVEIIYQRENMGSLISATLFSPYVLGRVSPLKVLIEPPR